MSDYMQRASKPNCWECKHKQNIPGDCHIGCGNFAAKVSGDPHGIRNGWFYWPFNFDPTWLKSCDGFEAKEKAQAVNNG